MSVIPASVKCDGCGKNRQEDGNHWLSIADSPTGIHFQRNVTDSRQWHVCGQDCASKLFARWLSTGKLDE